MRKLVTAIVILSAIFMAGLFFFKLLATPLAWQKASTTSPYQSQLNSNVRQPVNPVESGSWYCPMDPNYQPKYDWYNSSQVHREWWCW